MPAAGPALLPGVLGLIAPWIIRLAAAGLPRAGQGSCSRRLRVAAERVFRPAASSLPAAMLADSVIADAAADTAVEIL